MMMIEMLNSAFEDIHTMVSAPGVLRITYFTNENVLRCPIV